MADDEATMGPITRAQRSIAAVLGRPAPEATTAQYLAPKTINPRRDKAVILMEIKLGRTYIRCKDLTQAPTAQRGRKRTSHCWKWGEDLRLKDGTIGQPDVYYCYLCEREERKQTLPVVSSGRATAVDHLIKVHQMDKATGMIRARREAPPAGQATLDNMGEYGQQRSLSFTRNFDRLKALIVRWIVCCHIAFFQFENCYFRELLEFLSPGLDTYLPRAGSTIRRWVIEAWQEKKQQLKEELRLAHSAISISFDLWTSPNGHAVLGVCGHFISAAGERRNVVLALREVLGDHSGENIAQALLAVIREYGFQGNVGFTMSDNAESNDTCVDILLRILYPGMSAKARKARRLRCFGHIINRCANDFIVGKDSNSICGEVAVALAEHNFGEVQRLWKLQGAVGLMQNIIRYIRSGPQHRGFFRRIKRGGLLAEWDGLEVSLGTLSERLLADYLLFRAASERTHAIEIDFYHMTSTRRVVMTLASRCLTHLFTFLMRV
jgi:hypothetical protein